MARKSKRKIVKQKKRPNTQRSIPSQGDVNEQKFNWNTKSVDMEGDWGWSQIDTEDLLKEVIPKLQEHGKRTWAEIESEAGEDKSHFIDYFDLCEKNKNVKEELDRLRMNEIEGLFSLRLSGRERIFGRREGSVFHVLWWDPKHTVYPSRKKHT